MKFSNFANSWSWELKFLQDFDLVLKRTNPGSFFDPTNFGTNFHRWFGKPEKILVQKNEANISDFMGYDDEGCDYIN